MNILAISTLPLQKYDHIPKIKYIYIYIYNIYIYIYIIVRKGVSAPHL